MGLVGRVVVCVIKRDSSLLVIYPLFLIYGVFLLVNENGRSVD